MIHFKAMTKLVYNYAVKNFGWCKHQQTIKIKITLRRTASPSCLLIAYCNPSVSYDEQGGIIRNSLWNNIQSFIRKFINLFKCELRSCILFFFNPARCFSINSFFRSINASISAFGVFIGARTSNPSDVISRQRVLRFERLII